MALHFWHLIRVSLECSENSRQMEQRGSFGKGHLVLRPLWVFFVMSCLRGFDEGEERGDSEIGWSWLSKLIKACIDFIYLLFKTSRFICFLLFIYFCFDMLCIFIFAIFYFFMRLFFIWDCVFGIIDNKNKYLYYIYFRSIIKYIF